MLALALIMAIALACGIQSVNAPELTPTTPEAQKRGEQKVNNPILQRYFSVHWMKG